MAPPVRPDHARALVATSLAALLRKSISVDEWGMMVSIIVSTAEKTATVMKGVLEEKQDAINNMQKREAGLNFWPLPKCFFIDTVWIELVSGCDSEVIYSGGAFYIFHWFNL